MPTFGLLGPLLLHDGIQDRSAGGHKGRVLLAALLLQANRMVPKDGLKEALWGPHPPPTADASLFNHVTRLRRQLAFLGDQPRRLAAVPNGYRLYIGEGEFDVEIFEAHASATREAHLHRDWETVARRSTAAVALWRGQPLADLPDFADAEPQARVVQQLLETRLQVLEWGFDATLALGRHHELVPHLTSLASEHPLREAFHQQLMLALHRSNRQAEALQVYAGLRRNLVEELGVEPSAAVRATHQEVLADDGAAAVAAPASVSVSRPERRPLRQLPADAVSFTGRDREITTLTALLRPGTDAPAHPPGRSPRPVVVSGMGGIGKTALALHVAHRLHEDFPDGQLYADLRGFGPGAQRSPRDLLTRFLSDLGVRAESFPDDTDDCAALFRTVMAERRMLLVLDNARDAAQVTPLLPGTGDCAVVVTSRHTLADLPDATFVPLSPLEPDDQEMLLAALCGSRRVLEEPAAAADILARCGGLPLALRVVGGRLASRPAWPLALLAQRLSAGSGRLRELSVGGLDVHSTFAVSYGALRESERPRERTVARAFRLLGLWPEQELTPQSAAALLGLPVRETARLLDLLADAHLVQSPAPDRYGFHDLLGEYAAERAFEEETPQERADATLRLLSWYVAAVEKASRATIGETQPPPPLDEQPDEPVPDFTDAHQALEWYVQELPAIRHAIDRAGSLGRSDVAWRLAVGLFGYADTYWWTGAWDICLQAALAIAEEHDDTVGQAWLYRRIAVAHGMAYRNDACLENLRISLDLFARAGDLTAQASILGNMSALHVQDGRAEEALAYALRSQELYRRSGSTVSEALVRGRIADALDLAGDFEGAAEQHRRRIPLLRNQARPTALATALTHYGSALKELGLRDEAFAALDEALAIRRGLGDQGGEADCLAETARAHHHFGEWEAARRCWHTCLDLARAHALPQRARESLEGIAALDRACTTGGPA
ncbi:regulator [Streptomyces cellostaticus]|uniref:Regulator n=1 Tax=Streptomyces cellostaticus TaxID=67285 RepID=A0A117PWL7_9ACTN|nr:BTAD domain-containing putative transcriptional regulator [Streptomyces cellostaticus]KUM95273.1 regulator [Streptomyces cellostaticus]GHI02065.1 SARP family transcriptional regulator [Streptomyces cellostaticus]